MQPFAPADPIEEATLALEEFLETGECRRVHDEQSTRLYVRHPFAHLPALIQWCDQHPEGVPELLADQPPPAGRPLLILLPEQVQRALIRRG